MSLVRVIPIIFCSRAEPPEPGNLAELLLRQRVKRGVGRNPEVAGERQFKPDPETIPAVGDDHRLRAARRRRDVPGKLGDLLGRCFHEAADVTPAGKMLADRADHDNPHALIFVQCLEHEPQLVALRHRDDVERWAVENDVGALAHLVDFDLETVEPGKP